jgi:hypothetical protein
MTGDFWMIELIGSAYDLCCYQRWFCDQTAKVIEENGKYYFTGSHLMGCTTADQAMQKAKDKLELMAAAGRLESGSDAPMIRVGSAVYVDPSGIHHSYSFLEAGSRSGASLRIFDSFCPSLPHQAVAIAGLDTHLATALTLWGEPSRTWSKLSRICEEISCSFYPNQNQKKDVSEVLFMNNLIDSTEEFIQFYYTANSPEAGDDARHAKRYNRRLPTELKHLENPFMTRSEALVFVGSVLSRAFRRKWESTSEDSTNI